METPSFEAPGGVGRGAHGPGQGARLTLTRPDDWHVHLRDGAMLARAVADTARRFARAIVMPDLDPPIGKAHEALAYRARILAALPAGARLEPLMTLYLTETTTSSEVARAQASGIVHALKYYPAGATTITAHHLLLDRNALFDGGLRPRHYCRPLLKARRPPCRAGRRRDRQQPESLPRDRQRAASPARQGVVVRVRRNLYRARGARTLCRGFRKGPCAR